MLDKTYQPSAVEARWYDLWERSRGFSADPDSGKPPYTIMMPPPNVTGSLHMGHALTFTLQDLLVRYQRMRGRDVLWQPGTDHAGIATEIVVTNQLAEMQINKQRLGRNHARDPALRFLVRQFAPVMRDRAAAFARPYLAAQKPEAAPVVGVHRQHRVE